MEPSTRPSNPQWGRPGYGHDWYDRHYNHHHHWHHGWWHRPWRPPYCWGYWWNRYPCLTAFGLTTWAINRTAWAFGYDNYYNPYAAGTTYIDNSVYNYSQPIVMAPGEQSLGGDPNVAPESQIPPDSLTDFDTARQEFYNGNYEAALTSTDEALKDNPNDAVIHEFRALTLFAMEEYQDSAATLYAVLSVGPGWDWTTLVGLYPDVATYTKQLRALESYVGENPDDTSGLFVLSYQYITAGHDEAAATELKRLIKLTPSDPVTIQMLLEVDPDAKLPDPPKEIEPPKPSSAVEAAELEGDWKADRDGRRFNMELRQDGTFSWTYTEGNESQNVTGVWEVDKDGVLAMQMNDQGVMVAQIVPQSGGTIDFYMVGDTQGSPPLNFKKS